MYKGVINSIIVSLRWPNSFFFSKWRHYYPRITHGRYTYVPYLAFRTFCTGANKPNFHYVVYIWYIPVHRKPKHFKLGRAPRRDGGSGKPAGSNFETTTLSLSPPWPLSPSGVFPSAREGPPPTHRPQSHTSWHPHGCHHGRNACPRMANQGPGPPQWKCVKPSKPSVLFTASSCTCIE